MNTNKYLELRANARKWKHKDEGILKAAMGTFIGLGRTDIKRNLLETDEDYKNRAKAVQALGNFDVSLVDVPSEDETTKSSVTNTTNNADWTSQFRAGLGTTSTGASVDTAIKPAATAKPDMSKVRSDRNNNPLNIRFTNIAWLGKKTEGKSDNDFEEFESRDYGWRAAYKNIETKMKRGLNTITKLVSEWAPPSENNTNGYIQFVALKTGIDPNATITLVDLPKIGAAMAAVESGRRDNIDWDDALRGFKFYLGQPV